MKIIAGSFLIVKIFIVILLVWAIQTLFLHELVNNGISGDDLEWLFYFHAYRGDLISQFPFIWNDRTIYIVQEIYYMGMLEGIFGFLNLPAFQLTHLLFKSLATLSLYFLIFSLLKNRLFAFLAAFFFIISSSTTGVFELVVYGTCFLSISFICFFILFYIQSLKDSKKILLASLFLFLALVLCPPRTFPIIVVPFVVELIRLIRKFRPFVFLRRLLIFYFLPFTLFGGDARHVTGGSWVVHLYDFTAGNYYSITYPLQVLSSLFIDKSFLEYIFGQWKNVNLNVVLALQLLLLPFSIFLGLIIKTKKLGIFLVKITLLTFLLQAILYVLGSLSHDLPPGFAIIQKVNFNTISFLQASLGGYLLIFGLFLGFECWQNQRNNHLMRVLVAAWLWTVISLILIWFSAGGVQIADQVDRRYVLLTSLGAVVFTAGIFTLAIESLLKIRNRAAKISSLFLICVALLTITFGNYRFLDQYFYKRNQELGFDSSWQKLMYQRFLNKFGKANLHKDAFIYIDFSGSEEKDRIFYTNSVGIIYKLIYYEDGHLIRDNCKAVVHDPRVLKKSYTVVNGEKGFIFDTICVNPVIGQDGKPHYYSLDNFYAYSLQNREFVDIKEKTIAELDQAVP